MHFKYRLVLILLIFGIEFSFAQSEYKHYVKKLSSRNFAGRGYTHSGMNKAADFICKQLIKNNLNPFFSSFTDTFYHSVNTITYSNLKVDKKTLQPGIDYIIHPASGSVSGVFFIENQAKSNTAYYIGKNLTSIKQIQFLDSIHKSRSIPVFISSVSKLTNFVSADQLSFTHVILNDTSFSGKVVEIKTKTEFINRFEAHNVIAKIEGQIKDSVILLSAHYDHLGTMGKAVFYGANDNASGTAFLLDLARYFSKQKPKYTLVFAFMASEEAGLIGSKNLAERFYRNQIKIKAMLNFDLMGFGEDGITVVNGKENPHFVNDLKKLNLEKSTFKEIKVRQNAPNSDHYHFALKGYPAIFIYTMGNSKFYHDVFDTHQHLNYDFYPKVFDFFKDFIQKM